MLSSRAYRAISTSPALRANLNTSKSLQFGFKSHQIRAQQLSRPTVDSLGVFRTYSSPSTNAISKDASNGASSSSAGSSSSSNTPSSASAPTITLDVNSQEPVKLEPRLQMTFTCTVPDCGTRSTHEFTKRAYERGIVLVQCPGCQNRHLIADHLGWFKESTEDGKLKTVEDLLKARGEIVKRGRLHADGDIEYVEE